MKKKLAFLLLFATANRLPAQQGFQLAPPVVKMQTAYIRNPIAVEVRFHQPGAAVHYTFSNRDPLPTDSVYQSPISIKKEGTLRLKAMGENFQSSETITLPFYNAGVRIDSILTSPPQQSYQHQDPRTLNDAVGGIANFRSGSWTGYNSDSVWIECRWKQPVLIRQLELALLQDQASWIFLPKRIECLVQDQSTQKWKQVKFKDIPSMGKDSKKLCMEGFSWEKGLRTSAVKILMINHTKIPAWHESKGERAWIFIDEIFVK